MWRLVFKAEVAWLIIFLIEAISYLADVSQVGALITRNPLKNVVPNVFNQHLLSTLHVFDDH